MVLKIAETGIRAISTVIPRCRTACSHRSSLLSFTKDNGYHFLCFSEHDIFTDYREQFNTEHFIIVPAVESSVVLYRAKGTSERYKIHHLHGILGTQAMQEAAPWEPTDTCSTSPYEIFRGVDRA